MLTIIIFANVLNYLFMLNKYYRTGFIVYMQKNVDIIYDNFKISSELETN